MSRTALRWVVISVWRTGIRSTYKECKGQVKNARRSPHTSLHKGSMEPWNKAPTRHPHRPAASS